MVIFTVCLYAFRSMDVDEISARRARWGGQEVEMRVAVCQVRAVSGDVMRAVFVTTRMTLQTAIVVFFVGTQYCLLVRHQWFAAARTHFSSLWNMSQTVRSELVGFVGWLVNEGLVVKRDSTAGTAETLLVVVIVERHNMGTGDRFATARTLVNEPLLEVFFAIELAIFILVLVKS